MSALSPPVLDRVVDGRYRVESLLARGGMAGVYEAVDLRLERRVALKVMHAELARDEAFAAAFRQEALAAARLSHPHVVGVFDQGVDDDVVFLAMELVPGRTLRDAIRERAPMSVQQAVLLLDPVLAALAAAHEVGLAHRDVKPENVLIDDRGRVKVADFGLARAVTTTTATRGEVTWGTAAYLSPEQVEHGRADARSDVYSATLLLYEVLTGVKAFPGSSPIQVAYQHVHGEVPRAGELVPTVPAELDALLQWGAAKDPAERPADAGQLRAALQRAAGQLSEQELEARPGAQARARARPVGAAAAMAAAGSADQARAWVGDGERSWTADDADAERLHTQRLTPDRTQQVPRLTGADGHYARTRGNRPPRSSRPNAQLPPQAPVPVAAAAPPRRRRRVLPWMLAFLLLLMAAGGAGATWYWTEGPGVHSAMPKVVGLPEDRARDQLAAVELSPAVEQDYSETVPAGEVIAASADPGTQLRHGTEVQLVVSRGPERYAVPDVAGRTTEEARQLLEEQNLALGQTESAWDEEVPEGQVLSFTPEQGEQVKPGTEVDLVLSAGPEPIDIPQVVGQPEEAARQALTEAGFTVEVAPEQVFHDEVPAGAVTAQSPEGGTGHRGDPVTLTLSKGPETVEVPRVIGMQYQRAQQTLEELGLKVEREDLAGGYFNTVRFQSVDPGQRLSKGETVTLTVL